MLTRKFYFFFFNDTATTEIYTLSLHDALPISRNRSALRPWPDFSRDVTACWLPPISPRAAFTCRTSLDRKSTRLNSSHSQISYAVFCLKKKNNILLLNQMHERINSQKIYSLII